MKFIVARTALKNPEIKGRTLYLTAHRMWTSDRNGAREFTTESEARQYADDAVVVQL